MSILQNERLRCGNPVCQQELVLHRAAITTNEILPRCASCGYAMRRVYTPPRLRAITEPDVVRSLHEKFASGVR